MSFAGHVFDMVARMKANERRKRRPFDRKVEVKSTRIRAAFLQRPSEEEVLRVRQQIAAQRARDRRIGYIVLLVAVAITAMLVWWLLL